MRATSAAPSSPFRLVTACGNAIALRALWPGQAMAVRVWEAPRNVTASQQRREMPPSTPTNSPSRSRWATKVLTHSCLSDGQDSLRSALVGSGPAAGCASPSGGGPARAEAASSGASPILTAPKTPCLGPHNVVHKDQRQHKIRSPYASGLQASSNAARKLRRRRGSADAPENMCACMCGVGLGRRWGSMCKLMWRGGLGTIWYRSHCH